MHNVLFNNRRTLGTTSLKLHSKEAGVKNKKFLDDLVNGVFGWQVQDDLKEGLDRGVKEIPAFFINDEPFKGKPTFENLRKVIDSALRKAKRKPAAGPVNELNRIQHIRISDPSIPEGFFFYTFRTVKKENWIIILM
jgi:hypothetical protein